MENTPNTTGFDFHRQAQVLVCLDTFERLCRAAKGVCRIVPLKGIDLARTIYAGTLDREMHDLDLLILPEEKAMDFIRLLQEEGYRPEFAYALDKEALGSKKKVSMLAPAANKPHVDVHLALVTKRFFARTVQGFNQDAIRRLHTEDDVVATLDETDRWLFLATHLAFHFLTGEKWYIDLAQLLERMDKEQTAHLEEQAKYYHMERVVGAVITGLERRYPSLKGRVDVRSLLGDEQGRRFLHYTDYVAARAEHIAHGFSPARYYWEMVFISRPEQRRQEWFRLIFPSLGTVQTIYRCRSTAAVLLYLPHAVMNLLGTAAFYVYYRCLSSLTNTEHDA